MVMATLTCKGQVTIPKKVRETLNLRTGDKIEIIVTDNKEAVIRPVSKKVDDIFCKLYRPDRKPVSVEAMDEVVRRKIRKKFA